MYEDILCPAAGMKESSFDLAFASNRSFYSPVFSPVRMPF